MDKYLIMRIINMILLIFAIVGWSVVHRRYREPAAITPLTWLINVLAFYLFRFYTVYGETKIPGAVNCINTWSTLIITHGLILLAFGSWLAYARLKNNKTYMDRLAAKIKEEQEREG